MNTLIGSGSSTVDSILYGMARAFFVLAYTEYAEEHGSGDIPKAGPGEDWFSVAPGVTPPYAYVLASQLVEKLGGQLALLLLVEAACKADKVTSIDYDDFGHCLAMEAMGHGVGWEDNHKPFPRPKVRIEVGAHTFDSRCYAEEP
jgi:hypothetical protein